jgi:hypothetical protein
MEGFIAPEYARPPAVLATTLLLMWSERQKALLVLSANWCSLTLLSGRLTDLMI